MLTVNRGDLNAIREKLRAVGAKVGRATVRQAARRAMAPVRAQVKRDAPYDAEGDDVHIKSEVAMTSKWRGDTLTVKVGIRGGGRKNPETPFYFRMHELGTKHLPARPFMTPALESNAQSILDAVADELKKALGL